MVKDGMMERFRIEEVYGMHNLPGLPVGQFAIRKGAIMAATDEFTITIKGRGGHAAMPHMAIDPIAIGAQVVANLQLIASRTVDPLRSVVVSVTKFNAGFAHNVIPNEASLAGTVRTLDDEVRNIAEHRLRQIVTSLASAHGAEAEIHFHRNYPVTFNHATETEHAAAAARVIAGDQNVNAEVDPLMGGEDFSYMLNARPGAFIFIGNGDSANLHNAAYDFNDDVIAHGISYWVRLAEQRLDS
jgi:hippurate hydrolase